MRAEKELIGAEYLERLNASPYFIVVDYTGLKVGPMTDLRRRLGGVRAELHVVKNSIFRVAAKEAGIEDLSATLRGQAAVVTGAGDLAAAAKILKNFHAEFEKPKIHFGYSNNQRLDSRMVMAIAELPPLNQLRSKLIGLLNTPAIRLAQVIQAPAGQLVRALKARVDKGE